MDLKALRKRCEARLRTLDLPSPLNAHLFSESLATRRGRPIALCPVVSMTGPCGVWVAGPAADYIFYEQDTSLLHQEHIILHELSHLLCGHDATPALEVQYTQLLFPDLRPELVQTVLRRAAYSSEQEQEAELLASLILEHVATRQPAGTPERSPEAADLLSCLETSLVPDGEEQA
jgi:hypothetical protein